MLECAHRQEGENGQQYQVLLSLIAMVINVHFRDLMAQLASKRLSVDEMREEIMRSDGTDLGSGDDELSRWDAELRQRTARVTIVRLIATDLISVCL